MQLKKLTLTNFRNYQSLNLSLEAGINIIRGENGLGKTNILEAINILSIGKSFRNLLLKKCINKEANFARIEAMVQINSKQEGEKKMVVLLDNIEEYKTIYKIEDSNLSAVNFVWKFKSIVFFPEELNIFILNPEYRRKYFDKILCQLDKKYWQSLSEYRKVLISRNKILKNSGSFGSVFQNEIYFWDNQLVKTGSYLVMKRLELVSFFNQFLSEIYSKMADKKSSLKINYTNHLAKSHWDNGGDFDEFIENITDSLTSFREADYYALQENYRQKLKEHQERDIECRTTFFGPHRDDFKIDLDGLLLKESASRGEMRSVMLALKEAEIKLLEDNFQVKPILLLDDIFSELDKKRQQKVLAMLQGKQVVVTTAEEGFKALRGKVLEL